MGCPPSRASTSSRTKKGTVVCTSARPRACALAAATFKRRAGTEGVHPVLHGAVGDLRAVPMRPTRRKPRSSRTRSSRSTGPATTSSFGTTRTSSQHFGSERCVRASHSPGGAATWPRLEVVRRPTPDSARYFGPYHSATAARRTLHLVNKHFQLRTCGDVEFASRKRPCLQHHIKRCPAPCVLAVDRVWYAEQVEAVTKFLDGRHDELSKLQDIDEAIGPRYALRLAAVCEVPTARGRQDSRRTASGHGRQGRSRCHRLLSRRRSRRISLLRVRHGKLADVGAPRSNGPRCRTKRSLPPFSPSITRPPPEARAIRPWPRPWSRR